MEFTITSASEIGRRAYQEDGYAVLHFPQDGYLLAVFDGHGGSGAMDLCKNRLVFLWSQVRNKILVANFEEILLGVFQKLNEETRQLHSGCAASIVFIPENGEEVIVGVLGDAPVIVKQKDGSAWVAPEHNVRSNKGEAKAAIARGGIIQGGYLYNPGSGNGLQMSRALGDASLDDILSREPEIFRLPTGPGSYVLVASDGILDPGHFNGTALDIQETDTAESLVQAALAVPTWNNVTAILVRFK